MPRFLVDAFDEPGDLSYAKFPRGHVWRDGKSKLCLVPSSPHAWMMDALRVHIIEIDHSILCTLDPWDMIDHSILCTLDPWDMMPSIVPSSLQQYNENDSIM